MQSPQGSYLHGGGLPTPLSDLSHVIPTIPVYLSDTLRV